MVTQDISATFRKTKDNNLQLSFILSQQFWAYINADPKEKQEKAIPACNIAKIAKQKVMEILCATLQLTNITFVSAMYSCKYVKVSQQEKHRTKILWLQYLCFFKNGRLVNHDDPTLKYSNLICIT